MKKTFLLETYLVQNPTNSWCVDSGCTNHICNSLQGFQETRKLNEGEMFLTLADGSRILVVAMRYLHIWGCPAHVLKRKSDKLEAKTEVCMFLGYSKETKGY